PVFPDRFKRQLVHTAAPMDGAMVDRARERAAKLCTAGRIGPELAQAAEQVLRDIYASPEVQSLESYSDQAVLVNAAIWRRMLGPASDVPELVYLDLETIAARTMATDCRNAESLISRVLFDDSIRATVADALDGERACWDRRRLRARAQGEDAGANAGTVFFWGLDAQGRRVPLDLQSTGNGCAALAGLDDRGEPHEHPLEPESIIDALEQGRLMPALFAAYACIGFARGVTCAGGYYQAEYLPRMQQALVDALSQRAEDEPKANAVKQVPTDVYLSGMQAVMTPLAGETLVPAGAIEIIASGGLDDLALQRVRDLSVLEAHLASVLETVMDATPHAAGDEGWFEQIGHDLYRDLGNRLVIT
ncbi:MAG: hypothetical protein ACR2RL_19740, partial [Gammaproteobacteria bacterium]